MKTKKIFYLLLIVAIYQIIIFFFGKNWLSDIVPIGDFAGGVAIINELKHIITQVHLSNWSTIRFCGCPNTILWTSLNGIAYIPFTILLKPITAIKVGSLFYLGLSGTTMFVVAQKLTQKATIAFWAGLAYMLSPIFLFNAIHTGHTNFPPYYAWQPLVFLALWQLVKHPTRIKLLWASIALMLAVWLDTERACTSLPLFILVLPMLCSKKATPAITTNPIKHTAIRYGWLISTAIIAFLIGSFFLIPTIIESRYMALFSESQLADAHATFGLNNILSVVDRNGYISQKLSPYLPQRYWSDAGNYYLGISTILLASIAFLARKPKDQRIRLTFWFIALCICLTWPASGTHSIHNNFTEQLTTLYHHLQYPTDHPYLLPTIALSFAIIISALWWLRIKIKCPPFTLIQITLALGFILLVSHTAIFKAMVLLPAYSHLRNPGYFMSALPPLLLIISGSWVLHYFTENLSSSKYFLIIFMAIIATIADYYPYHDGFDNRIPPQQITEFMKASKAMKEHPAPGRYLSRESYNPLADMHTVFSDRTTAWYWLNWSCPKPTYKAFMDKIYAQLHHPDTINHALGLAGLFNVRFITYDLLQGQAPKTEVLESVFTGNTYAIFENSLCRDFVQTYQLDPDSKSPSTFNDLLALKPTASQKTITISKPDNIEIDIKCDTLTLLVLSQSYYPGWQVTADQQPISPNTIEGALPAITLEPGKHHITFSYSRPWYYYFASLLSILTLITLIYFLRRNTARIATKPGATS